MKNIWRFYDLENDIAGICYGKNIMEAKSNAEFYIATYLKNVVNIDVLVWEIKEDDAFIEDCPYAILIN